ncbi:SDR family NAD(P)-dependent oxidoreductase [Nonomuraea roseoviolacea]|uniref:NAD(P)-dependent dehydrogenase (Short-subunit alcohol dehydrogenase family) n=1 Tax=Nonomuraea roseoviolacea subsp. carminata TaxID=160689 RepID=A0ABT1KDZ0_9ACTN|nr:glucose 1-dehydrogenase [Nonomuraea roseoviolacea]MCP2351576.1 NAD(P)-dependent dehydrogenase (short-subunit alcohol dehydrogenase family) [Nonomuraea roseoviolacea subsp. carminata]
MRLAGKVAIVTGAAGGIGAATAARFAAEGAFVTCVDLRAEAVAELAGRIGPHAHGIAADVASPDDNARIVEQTVRRFGGVDVFVANAAVQFMGRIDDTAPEQWDRLHAVNLRGVYLGVQAVLPALRHRGGGSIVITASLLGIVGDPDMPAYGAMKGGLRSMARALAAAHGPEGVRVNTICPGDVETELLDDFFAFQPDPHAARERLVERYPLRRFAAPDDVAAAALFLASDDAAYITGTDLVVDGGLLAQIY